jgi:hypothetical protein
MNLLCQASRYLATEKLWYEILMGPDGCPRPGKGLKEVKVPDIKAAIELAEPVKATCWLMKNLIKNLNGERQSGAVLDGVELHGLASVFEDIVTDM